MKRAEHELAGAVVITTFAAIYQLWWIPSGGLGSIEQSYVLGFCIGVAVVLFVMAVWDFVRA